jgi:hypothetical protein
VFYPQILLYLLVLSMHFPSAVVAVAAMVAGGARANMDFNLDSAPPDCRTMCQPVGQLSDACEADLGGDSTDLAEEELAAQCFCTNESFQVAQVAALCYDCIRQAVEAAGGDDGTAPAVQVKRQAVDGSDCLNNDQCSSGFCAESNEIGRPGNVCQTPGEVQEPDQDQEPVPVGTPIGAPCDSNEECITGLCAETAGSDTTICLVPSGNGGGGGGEEENDNEEEEGGQAVNGSDCLTDDQCSSGFCAESNENGRPGNVCQPRPDAPAPPATDDSPPPAPSTVDSPPATPTTVDSPPAAPTTIAPPTTSAAVSNPGSFITIVPPASTASPSTTALPVPGDDVDLASWEDALSRK